MSTYWFDLSNNRLTGRVGEDTRGNLRSIKYLNLSKNYFEGTISSSFCNMTNTIQLDLSYNNFRGEIPMELIAGCIPIIVLKLASNMFEGEIFSTSFNLRWVMFLHLEDNHFSGHVSNAITNISSLTMLDISNNHFAGGISSWISNMTRLQAAIMHNNVFTGLLPSELPVFSLLNIARNRLSGPLPSGFKFDLEHLGLAGNKLTGPIPDAFLNSSSLHTLDMRDNLLSGEISKSIHTLANLRVLLLGSNNLNGSIPKQICELNKLSLIDLSNNKISGNIPHCINNISFGKYAVDDQVYKLNNGLSWIEPPLATYGNFLVKNFSRQDVEEYDELVVVEFITKRRSESYKGNILRCMSGMDLSYNNLTGEIPYEIGDLISIHAVNLSHNHFTGSIPETFYHLSQLESLDLSYNRLSGEIPTTLLNLHFLAVFSVAYNNLSGRIPDMKAQFGTFDSNSYEGNPHLCGPPLERGCVTTGGLPKTSPILEEGDEKWYEIDITDCYPTFVVSYGIFFLAVIVVFQVNPYWHTKLLNFVELCYYDIGGKSNTSLEYPEKVLVIDSTESN